ncbi:FAD/NAD(P)-binding protein [Kutzneria chonburiensis]|uniref:FAD/NAD(P)-binding protein n=1 Tax=Kutzneria chonburiensis TaxID=1483604 RepID=A0ABV6MJM0_9PSEU|nr:FAD/NAD(P)-binding protein [Kutzneria chonburiensis]
MTTLVFVGAGPRATGLLERIAANLPEFPQALDIHLVDPHPPGAGRVWRHAQSPLLRMNSMAEDVTMFTDDSVVCEGPIRPGPSLYEWAEQVRAGGLDDSVLTEQVRALRGNSFPTRQLQSRYLEWVFDTVVKQLPDTVTVTVHPTTALTVSDGPDGRQLVPLADGETLVADLVVITLGHLDSDPLPAHQELAKYAADNDLRYLPPQYAADTDVSGLRPGEHVVMRGFGLSFIDLMVLLTEGRGGRFTEQSPGVLHYEPSGREPVLHVGSRRGVPYHSKTNYRLLADRPPLPRFFTPEVVDAFPAGSDFRADVWPLLAKEIAWAYYHELFNGHPTRVRMDWTDFDRWYAPLPWGSPTLDSLIRRAVPSADDRIDFEALDRPLLGRTVTEGQLREHIAADIARRTDDRFSADLGAFFGLLSCYGQLQRLKSLRPASQVRDLDGWWRGFFSFMASGPPDDRLRQLLALHDAGIVRFLGADLRVEAADGVFRAAGGSGSVAATALVEAYQPATSVRTSGSALLRALDGVEEILVDGTDSFPTGLLRIAPDGRMITPAGRPHPRRYGLGHYSTERAVAAFARPRTNAPAFRQNDATARALLAALAV